MKRPAVKLLLLVGVLLLTSGFGAEDMTDLQITVTGSPAQELVQSLPFGNITWTMVVTNNGPLADPNVQVSDPLPVGTVYVDASPRAGTCSGGTNGADLNCSLGTVAAGRSVTITLVTTPTNEGRITNTATVSGDLAETTVANNTASASVEVFACHCGGQRFCTAVDPRPKQLYIGKSTTMHITITKNLVGTRHKSPVAGVRVHIKGPGIDFRTRPSNTRGKITARIKPKRVGIAVFRPIATKACKVARVGITDIFGPPVTG